MADKKRIKLKVCLVIFLFVSIGFLFYLSGMGFTGLNRAKSDKIKVGLIMSPSVPYQLRQAIMKNVNSRENMALLCINTGYRVFDEDKETSSAVEKIRQLIDVGTDAVGLVYLDKKEQEKCLKILSDKNIPSFVISEDMAVNESADYTCCNDSNLAMNTAGRYIYSITADKDSVAVITDTKPEHKRMALAFSEQYCVLAKMESMNIYAVNVPGIPQRFSVLSPSKSGVMEALKNHNILGMREIINMGKMRKAGIMCDYQVGDNQYYCDYCDYNFFNNVDGRCPKCGRLAIALPESLGNVIEEQNIDSAISQIEKSKIETIYVIGDVAPLIANRRLMNQGYKGVKMVATGCELLTLASINGGNITANVEPDWRDMGNKFFNAIDCHFNKKLNSGKEVVSYIPKDFRYYNENTPLELPMGKGVRLNN